MIRLLTLHGDPRSAAGRRSACCHARPDLTRHTLPGYAPAPAGTTPDFIVTYRIAVFASENPRDAYAQIRDPTTLTGRELAPDPAGSEGLVREATLVLMALSGTSEKVIWQATASGIATSRRELSSGALRMASAMLDKFPGRAR